jgi:predicted TIM-barrel fold metal-dependent hydrolase
MMLEGIDAQILIWAPDGPDRRWPAEERGSPHIEGGYTASDALKEMDRAGVERAILVPPSWAGDENDIALEAAGRYPDRFAVMGRFNPMAVDAEHRLSRWPATPHLLGIRMTFHTPEFRSWLDDERLEWFWKRAEQLDIPIATHSGHGPERHGVTEKFSEIARNHPALPLIIDHMNLRHLQGQRAWDDLGELLALAVHDNVYVKLTCIPAYSADRYPFTDTHEPLRRIYDTFGPKRLMWGSDRTRLKVPYVESVDVIRHGLDFLSPDDKKWILGETVSSILHWP